MKITEKTKLKDITNFNYILNISNVDLLSECSKFELPEKIRGIKPVPFYNISFTNLSWLWDIKATEELLVAYAEIFFYPQLSKLQKLFNKNSETWAKKWVVACPLIDFYNFAYSTINKTKTAGDDFAKMKINLSKEEKEAGYGDEDPDGIKKMIDSFAKRQGISSIEEAGNYAWTIYKFVFKIDIDEANRQRRYNEIILKKQK